MTVFCKYAEVIVDLAIGKSLDYGIPSELLADLKKGMQVGIKVRGKVCKGVVSSIKDTSAFPKTLPILEILQEELIDEDLFDLSLWMSKYYNASLRDVFKVVLPAPIRQNITHKEQYMVFRAQSKETLQVHCSSLRQTFPAQSQVLDVLLLTKNGMLLTELLEKAQVSRSPIDSLVDKGLLFLDQVRIDRSPLINEAYFQTQPKILNEEQQSALDEMKKALDQHLFHAHLLYGITGSGKTEVYLQIIDYALQLQLGAIMLVPKISLTAQTIERFRSRFEDKIAILHSGLSKGERFDEWHRIRRGEAKIVIGARSAIFSPIKKLGLIIVDEEHDAAYKQSEESPCYHGRDVAVMRAKLSQSLVVLGTATPSLESYFNTQIGKYCLNHLSKRPAEATLPHVTIIDMKKEFEKAKGYTSFSEALLEGIKKRYTCGEQIILFLNRRGYHTSQTCQECGYVFKCPHCELSLIFHYKENALHCHLCDYKLFPSPKICAECERPSTLKFKGVGTEQIERSLHALFPEIRTLRMDADTTTHKGSHEKIFRSFSTGKADVLIGTQMITKGLHFPGVTLVAVLNSDPSLNVPDFRASEHVFQLITQVAGRAGRGHIPGEVLIQTHLPDHFVIRQGADQNFTQFFQQEIAIRKMFAYPPFMHFVKYCFSGKDSQIVSEYAEKLRGHLEKNANQGFIVHPLTPSGYAKIKDRFRFQFLVRCKNPHVLHLTTNRLLQTYPSPREIRLLIDVDPTMTFF